MLADKNPSIQNDLEKAHERERILLEEKNLWENKYNELLLEKRRKVKEQGNKIEKAKERFKLLTDSLPVSIVYVDAEKKYQFANKTAVEWRKGKLEEITGKFVLDVVGKEAYDTVSEYVEKALSGIQVRFESEISYPGGKRYTESQYVPHYEDGKVIGFYALVMDITEQIEARKAAESQRRRLNDLFMQAPAAICILSGPKLIFELVNPAYQQLFPGRKLLNKPLLEALPELRESIVDKTLQKVYTTGLTHEENEILISLARNDNGPLEDIYFNYIQQARFDENGNIDGVIVFAFDVTELVNSRLKIQESERELQAITEELITGNEELASANEKIQASNDELNALNNQLKSVNSDLDNFVYTASHDLKAPISNIEGLMRALIRYLPPEIMSQEDPRKITDMIMTSVERFQKTLAELTTITKLQREFNENATQVSLADLVEEVKLDLHSQLEEANVQSFIDLKLSPPILFSRKNLRSIVYNLFSNAIKYSSPDRTPVIKITWHQDENYTVLCVEDNGLGMSISDPSKIFGMFKRLHNHVEGSGLGLYIVKKIIDGAGGKIEVESKVDKGSVFKVYFKSDTTPK